MSFTVQTDEGVVSAHIPSGAFMDAAANDTMAGLELAVHSVIARDTAAPEYRAKCVVSLSMDPNTMKALVFLLAEKTNMPLLTASEWQTVVDVLRTSAARACHDLAEKIERGAE